jgi:hypothetical protein
MPDDSQRRSNSRRAYWERSARFCKPSTDVAVRPSERTRRIPASRRADKEQARLEYGMSLGPCQFITLVRGFNFDLNLRRDAWYLLRTRLLQEWADVQAWTCLESSADRGIHLHAVVRGAPGLDQTWLDHVVGLLPPDGRGQRVTAYLKPVSDAEGLAGYLTKQLRKPGYWEWLPRHFHLVSATRGWAPGWKESSSARVHDGKRKKV